MSVELSVNLNKIALIRNSRQTLHPDICRHASLCLAAGADGITVHPRPDQRHIRVDDCYALAELLGNKYPDVEFNIEGNPFAGAMKSDREDVSDYPGFMEIVRAIKPAQCTLVPDSNQQLTSDHGFDLNESGEQVKPILDELRSLGVRSSLFMDPDPAQIKLAKAIGADRIELYTGPYAEAVEKNENVEAVLAEFHRAALVAQELGLGLNAGHDLNLTNLQKFAAIPALLEVSIGHFLTIDAIEMGLSEAIAAYRRCLGNC